MRYEPEDAEPTWVAYFRAIRETASNDYSPTQVAAWAPESIDLAEWNERRLAVHTFVAIADAGFAQGERCRHDEQLSTAYGTVGWDGES